MFEKQIGNTLAPDKDRDKELRQERAAKDAKLAEYRVKDEESARAAREFRPNVRIVKYKAGEFLSFDKTEVPLRFIEGISIHSYGKEPHIHSSGFGLGRSHYSYACEAEKASVELSMSSGRTVYISCSRHEIDILHDALLSAWKTE